MCVACLMLHRRSQAYRQLEQFREAYADLRDITRKTEEDTHWIKILEIRLMPFAAMDGDGPWVVTDEYR